jgi:hypothetical protein
LVLTMVAQDAAQAGAEAEVEVEEKQQRWPKVTVWTSGAARDVDYGAVISGGEEGPFAYSPASERRAASEPKGDEPQGLRVLLMGKPSSGKGTQAPLMSRKYRMVHIATGG